MHYNTASQSTHNMDSFRTLLTILILAITFQQTHQLECYVCKNQEDNQNKCIQTVKTCDLDQDQCLSEVRWGSRPYWALTGQKQHYISKRCATKAECQEAIADKFHKCDRIWYNDWNCTACCSGDKCNSWVTLAAHSNHPSMTVLTASLIASFAFLTMRAHAKLNKL